MSSLKLSWVAVWLIGSFFGLVLLFGARVSAAPDKPYFKVFGGDTFVGGWFNQSQTTCTNTDLNYQAPDYNAASGSFVPVTQYRGGIMAYNKLISSKPAGASTDFGAMALGLIEGNASLDYGFSSGSDATKPSGLSLANNYSFSNYWGGFLEGATSQTHCIPDYFNTKKDQPTAWANQKFDQANSGQYTATAGTSPLTIDATGKKIGNGKRITIFVQGDVYISNDIKYQGGYRSYEIPQFALVVLGNIYIGPGVKELNGLYIAQPDLSNQATIDKSGVIWTCRDNTAALTSTFVVNNCKNSLTINGALIAKQVNFTRTAGDINKAKFGEDSNNNIAEIINYTPEMVISGPFFNSSADPSFDIESLISLPPVF